MYRLISLFVVACAIAALFMHVDRADGVYALSVDKVNAQIDRTKLPLVVFGPAAAIRHWRIDTATSVWAFLDEHGAESLRLSAITSADGDGARVRVEIAPPLGANREQVEQKLRDNEEIADLYRAGIAEQIDADLNGREFNMKSLAPAMARATVNSISKIRASTDKFAKNQERAENEVVDQAYAHERP